MLQVKQLSKEQEDALVCEGNSVIVAGPGSGKTTVLAHKIARILADAPPHKGVVAISYTNKASDELRDRVRLLSRDTKLSFFGTIDKFYIREIVLPFTRFLTGVNPKGEPRIIAESDTEWDTIAEELRQLVADMHGQGVLPGEGTPPATRMVLSKVALLYEQGQIHLQAVGALAFLAVHHSYACRRYLKARYTHVFVDEYQDSGFEQHALFMLLSRIGLVMTAVGDLNQSIFGFARKDSRYLRELTSIDGFELKELLDNHRCHPSIQDYASAFLGRKIGEPRKERRVFWKPITGDEESAAEWIDETLEKIKAKYGVRENARIAVLGRSGNTLSRIANAISVPTQYHVTMPIEEIAAPCAGFCTEVLRVWLGDKTRIQDLLDQIFNREAALGQWQAKRFLQELRSIGELYSQNNSDSVSDFLKRVCDRYRIPGWDSDFEDALRKTLAHGLLPQAFAPVQSDRVQLYTLHKSKGLEFDVVIHMDLHDYILPSTKSLSTKVPSRVRDWEMTQDVNLHYVGLTRARKAVFLVYQTVRHNAENEQKDGIRSRFLSEQLRPYAVQLRAYEPG